LDFAQTFEMETTYRIVDQPRRKNEKGGIFLKYKIIAVIAVVVLIVIIAFDRALGSVSRAWSEAFGRLR